MSLESLFFGLNTVGFSGSRHLSGAGLSALKQLFSLVPADCQISVGCAKGADAAVRSAFVDSNRLSIFSVNSGQFGYGRCAFARRSVAIVKSIPANGLVVVVPGFGYPIDVNPSRSFRGNGSGSWGSAAYALGTGRRLLLWLADGITPPHWDRIYWDCVETTTGGNWWLGIENGEWRMENEQLTIDGYLFG